MVAAAGQMVAGDHRHTTKGRPNDVSGCKTVKTDPSLGQKPSFEWAVRVLKQVGNETRPRWRPADLEEAMKKYERGNDAYRQDLKRLMLGEIAAWVALKRPTPSGVVEVVERDPRGGTPRAVVLSMREEWAAGDPASTVDSIAEHHGVTGRTVKRKCRGLSKGFPADKFLALVRSHNASIEQVAMQSGLPVERVRRLFERRTRWVPLAAVDRYCLEHGLSVVALWGELGGPEVVPNGGTCW
jgi:hypothetical protein